MTMDAEPLDIDESSISKPLPLDEKGEQPKRRGRPPGATNKTTTSPRSNTANVTAALATMGSLYDFMTMGLTMVSPIAAMELVDKLEQLQANNKRAFEASPKLAQRIATIGSGGGVTTFIVGNLIVLAPIIQKALPDIQRLLNGNSESNASRASS